MVDGQAVHVMCRWERRAGGCDFGVDQQDGNCSPPASVEVPGAGSGGGGGDDGGLGWPTSAVWPLGTLLFFFSGSPGS